MKGMRCWSGGGTRSTDVALLALLTSLWSGAGCRTHLLDDEPGSGVDFGAPSRDAGSRDAGCETGNCASGLAVGAFHTCAWFAAGDLWCWGANEKGQLGLGTASMAEPRPRRVTAVGSVVGAALGQAHSCVLLRDGTVRCWGADDKGQLGRGVTAPVALEPHAVPALDDVVELAAGLEFTCARRADRSVWCWGANSDGQLGRGTLSPFVASPQRVIAHLDDAVTQIAAGRFHACARMFKGTVRCWGHTAVRPTVPADAVPEVVPALDGAHHIAAGFLTSCAALVDGAVRCWGDRALAPTPIAGLDGVVEVGFGAFHGCARRSDATTWCWGQNAFGELGLGTRGPNQPPTRLGGLGPAAQLGVVNAHTCVREPSGALWCWGPNSSGQNGDGTFQDAAAPVRVRF